MTDSHFELPLNGVEELSQGQKGIQLWWSPVALAVSLPWRCIEHYVSASADPDQSIRQDVQRRLRLASLVLADHGIVCPVVGVLWGGRAFERGSPWAVDQDWHGGNFILYVEKDVEAAKDRLVDVLAPEPERLGEEEIVLPSLDEVLEALAKNVSNDDLRAVLCDLLRSPVPPKIEDQLAFWAEHGRAKDRQTPATNKNSSPGDHRPTFEVSRVEQLKIGGFRGITIPLRLHIDADLVLFLGPNGTGKSSVAEALSWALTGHALTERQRHGGLQNLCVSDEAPVVTLQVTPAADGDDASLKLIVTGDDYGEVTSARVASESFRASDNWFWPGTEIPPELQHRLTAFFQDEHRDLFDKRANGATLLQLLAPLPRPAERVERALRGEELMNDLGDVDHRLDQEVEEAAPERGEDLWERLRQATDPLIELTREISELREVATVGQHVPSTKDENDFDKKRGDSPETKVSGEIGESWGSLFESISGLDYIGVRPKSPTTWRRALRDYLEKAHKIVQNSIRESVRPEDENNVHQWQARVDELQQEIASLERRAGRSNEHLEWLGVREGTDGESELVLLFRLLEERRERWCSPPADLADDAERIRSEMARVEPDRVRLCAEDARRMQQEQRETAGILAKRRAEATELQSRLDEVYAANDQLEALKDLQARLEQLNQESVSTALDKAWDAYRSWIRIRDSYVERQKHLESFRARRRALDNLAEQGLRPPSTVSDEEIRRAWETAVGRIAGRFAMTGGSKVEAIRTERNAQDHKEPIPGLDLALSGKRRLEHFSAGQRAQLAIAQLLGQKAIASSQSRFRFPNRILVLDDVTSTHDLTNLTREALLWRQLAYHPEQNQRLQVILSSHHDTLSNRLIDLLVPPEGRSLRVLRFDEWTPASGPRVEPFDVCEASKISKQVKEALRRALC